MIKTCHKRSFLVLPLFSLVNLETRHKCTTPLSTDLAWIFNYFRVRVFVYFAYKKNKWISRKFQENNKLFDLEIYNVKPKCTNINFIKAICGIILLPLKWKLDLLTCKDTKKHELQNQIVACLNFPPWEVEVISTYFSVWLLNCKNKLLKVYCVPRL